MPEPPPRTLTKIIATIGPASEDPQTLDGLIHEGARVFRINFSHGTFDDFERVRNAIVEAGARSGKSVAIFGDLSGPKIRIGQVADGGIDVAIGQKVVLQKQTITGRLDDGHVARFSTTYPQVIDDVEPGQRVLIDDGNVRMLAVEHRGSGDNAELICQVTDGGNISSKKGINLPDTTIHTPSITDYDRQCIDWAVSNDLDYLALSFVRRADDLLELKDILKQKVGSRKPGMPVIAKIEKPEAIGDLEGIVCAADVIMVARGDLGVEMDLAQVPVIQKKIIKTCHDYGKPAIVATQMLQSMIDAPTPTRAESSDVANAIYDGADAVMLSGETAVGRFPTRAVHTMANIARAVEAHMKAESHDLDRTPVRLQQSRYRTAALAHGVSAVVKDLDAKLVVMWSQLGGGARYLSQNRLSIPIIVASSNPRALRQMALLFGVHPVNLATPDNAEEWIDLMDQVVVERGYAEPGDAVIAVHGEPFGTPGVTNKLRIHYIGDVCKVER